MQLCHGYFGDKGLKLIRLSINGNNFYENPHRLGGPWPPRPPTKSVPGSEEYFWRVYQWDAKKISSVAVM